MQDERIVDLVAASAECRRTMVDCQVRTFDVTDQVLLARMIEVPRELFLPPELAPFAYSDASLEIRPGECAERHRVLSAPLVLARLLQSAGIAPTDQVLDVGSAGGYVAALLAGLCETVVSLESDRLLHEFTRANLNAFGLTKVETMFGPHDRGVPGKAPFDVIIVNGAFEAGLEPLLGQLKNGGRLAAIARVAEDPTGRAGKAVLYERIDGSASFRTLFDAAAPVLEGFRKAPEFTFA
jgi:protein-L-isoaspartate(D-aspartate) O-methyltransferase